MMFPEKRSENETRDGAIICELGVYFRVRLKFGLSNPLFPVFSCFGFSRLSYIPAAHRPLPAFPQSLLPAPSNGGHHC